MASRNRNRIRIRIRSKPVQSSAALAEKKGLATNNENKKLTVSNENQQLLAGKQSKKPVVGTEAKNSAVGKTKMKKQRLGFLDLPGEIRNMIYAHCFEDEIWIDMTPTADHILKQNKVQLGTWASAAHAAPKPTTTTTSESNNEDTSNANPTATGEDTLALPHLTITGRRTARFSATTFATPTPRLKPQKIAYKPHSRRGHTTTTSPTKWTTSPGALVLTCRQIHHEALPFFYAAPFFIFSAPRPLLRFLALVPPPKLALVRKLHVAHATYGDPTRPRDEAWRTRHQAAWKRAMDEAARLLVGLAVLRCRVVANERPLVFALASAAWARTLVEAWGPACQRQRQQPGEGKEREKEKEMVVATVGGAPQGPLRVEIAVQSAWVVKGAYMPNEALRTALVELHRLFAEGVRRRMCGWSEEDAMLDFNLAKFEKYKRLSEVFPMP
ncbi:uncharacterized protein BKCO1_3600045 [Diplodia corticola]|uniref:DUF7730 domain-containing protein n=1 Tax=Diplodia corticola TaxID=236234 RepID=A0A1J9RY97_9PEZI|nr:uncharacterized protein BKCO1_3600045 [Diplodia corticola]OJD32788.1 hypothetical protein BKCO1_3600045 [Diplodia corticola]